MAIVGKRLKKIREQLDRQAVYKAKEAVELVKKYAVAKFDETIDVVVRLNIDARQSDQNIRGSVALPNGIGKDVKVAVFAKGDKAEKAKQAGADIVGAEDLVERIQGGDISFDRCIASPDMMVLVGKIGKILGPKGLMPNPKLGTVTNDIAEAVKAVKSGLVEYRAEKAGIVHAGIGKASFASQALEENLVAFMKQIVEARPSSVKGVFLRKIAISSTMGPSFTIDPASFY